MNRPSKSGVDSRAEKGEGSLIGDHSWVLNADVESLVGRLRTSLGQLPDKPEETAEATIRALWLAAGGTPCSAARSLELPLPELPVDGKQTLLALIEKRLAGVPLAHLTERQRFLGLELTVSRSAFVPRKETELLGRAAVEIAMKLSANQAEILVFDACTGAGNVALAVAHQLPGVEVVGGDLSEDAIALARRNAVALGLAERVRFRRGDLFEPLREIGARADLITCNPPYISCKRLAEMPEEISAHEPTVAFEAGPYGLRILDRLIMEAPQLMAAGGWLCFEVGVGQGPTMIKRMTRSTRYTEVEALADQNGIPRVVLGRVVRSEPLRLTV